LSSYMALLISAFPCLTFAFLNDMVNFLRTRRTIYLRVAFECEGTTAEVTVPVCPSEHLSQLTVGKTSSSDGRTVSYTPCRPSWTILSPPWSFRQITPPSRDSRSSLLFCRARIKSRCSRIMPTNSSLVRPSNSSTQPRSTRLAEVPSYLARANAQNLSPAW